jgi:hypothetical protein
MEVFEVVVALLLGGAALAAAFTQAIEALGSAFAGVLARYTQVWCIQLAQHAVCNRVHRVVERCARWLLQTQDRVGRAAFPRFVAGVTHQPSSNFRLADEALHYAYSMPIEDSNGGG